MQHTHPKVYLKITKLLGTPTVDLFVSRIYHERSYMTWKPDPNSFATDAERLAQNVCFCIPTFQLDRSGDTLLLRMSIQRPLLLPALTNLLLNPLGEEHPLLKSRSLRLEAWKIEGISSSATKLISISRKPGSIAGYESAWNKWVSWCCWQQIDLVCAPLSGILNYLSKLFEQGLQYRTINSHRSAILAYHDYVDGKPAGKHPRVCDLLTGVFNQRPPQPCNTIVWDVEILWFIWKQTCLIIHSCRIRIWHIN